MKEKEEEKASPVLEGYKLTPNQFADFVLSLKTIDNEHSKGAVIRALQKNIIPYYKEVK